MINPEILIPPSTFNRCNCSDFNRLQSSTTAAKIHPLTAVTLTTADVHVAANVQPSTSAAADIQPSTSAPAGTVFILDFGTTRFPKHTYIEFYDIFQTIYKLCKQKKEWC